MNESNDSTEMSFGRGDNASKGPIIPKSANEALRPEPVPSPPRRSRKARSQVVIFLNFIMTTIVLVTLAAAAVFYYALDSYEKPGPLKANTNFIVRNGAGLNEIAASLERNNIISDSRPPAPRGRSRESGSRRAPGWSWVVVGIGGDLNANYRAVPRRVDPRDVTAART